MNSLLQGIVRGSVARGEAERLLNVRVVRNAFAEPEQLIAEEPVRCRLQYCSCRILVSMTIQEIRQFINK